MKNNFKNVMRKVVFLHLFQTSLTPDFIEDSQFLLDASVFNLFSKLGNKYYQLFPLKRQAHWVHFPKRCVPYTKV